jgi:uridine kinase
MSSIGEPLRIHPLSRSVASNLANQLNINPSSRTVFAIGGESGSGKSTTGLALKHVLSELGLHTKLLHLDGYFNLPPRENNQRRIQSLENVGLHEVNMDLLQHHVNSFKEGVLDINIPVVDYMRNSIEFRNESLRDASVLIVEGTYALYLQHFDVGVFMERTYEDSRNARKGRIRENYDPFVEQVLAIEQPIVRASAPRAHFSVSATFELHQQ